MRVVILSLLITLTTPLFSQEVNSKISLAGKELLIYQEKQLISTSMILVGAGIAAWGAYDKEVKPALYLGSIVSLIGLKINIESIRNLRKSAKHMIEY